MNKIESHLGNEKKVRTDVVALGCDAMRPLPGMPMSMPPRMELRALAMHIPNPNMSDHRQVQLQD